MRLVRRTRYRAHGLIFDSEIELPYDLVETGQAESGSLSPDVEIVLGATSKPSDDALDVGALCHATPTRCWIHVPSMARYEAIDGNRLIVEPVDGADPAAVSAFATSSAIGALIHQRLIGAGGLLLEAAVVARDGKAVAILAHTGEGQSTLASTLTWGETGLTFVGDDLARVDFVDAPRGDAAAQVIVHGGTPEARLWPNTLRACGHDPTIWPQVHSEIRKRRVMMRDHERSAELAHGEPLELVGCIIAAERRVEEVEVQQLSGRERFAMLSTHTWRRRMVTAGNARNTHFVELTKLAAGIKVARISRPQHVEAFDEFRDGALAVVNEWIDEAQRG